MKNLSKSKGLYNTAKDLTIGGVQTNFKHMYPHPIYFSKADGSKVWDIDGNEYIDCVVGFGPCILGHGHPKVVEAVKQQLETGLTVGLETESSIQVCEKLAEMVPSAESVRLSNTGTEAVMHGIQMARAFTGRHRIVKVEGAYNGWYDDVLVSHSPPLSLAGPETSPNSVPDSGGLHSVDTLVIPFNDEHAAERTLKENRGQVAALIIEPIMFNIGCALPKEGYLKAIRELTEDNGVLLIFDEVRTGFRVAPGGAQQYYDVVPDLSVFAKAIANGFPLSAIVGSRDVMSLIDPVEGRVMYGGTYNGSQTAVAAANATLDILSTGKVQEKLNDASQGLIDSFGEIAEAKKIQARVQGLGGNFQVYFTDSPVADYRSTFRIDAAKYIKFQQSMLEQGVYFWPSHLFCHGVSASHSESDLDTIISIMRNAMGSF